MGRIQDPTPEQEAGWKDWVASRPGVVRAIAERFDPWSLYRMKSTGQRCTLAAIAEDGTVRVNITGDFNLVMFERSVFGVDPADLEDCDAPAADEVTGTVLADEDSVTQFIDEIRPAVLAQRAKD